ncbi:hypothetical protein D3C71_1452900 [compost metagenome]
MVFFSCVAITPRRQPVQPKFFEKEYTQIVLCGTSAISERKFGTKVPYTSSVTSTRSGFLRIKRTICFISTALNATDGGLLGFTVTASLIFGFSSLAISEAG